MYSGNWAISANISVKFVKTWMSKCVSTLD